jgi:hypothetical protein
MKYLTFIFLISIFFIACKKNTTQDLQQNLLVGKWQVINDSSSITGSLNGFNGGFNYIGTSNDYYNFTSDGNLFIREGQSLDTVTYTLSSNHKQVNILYSYIEGVYVSGNVAQPFIITDLTINRLTLTILENGPTPEGYLHKEINLQK